MEQENEATATITDPCHEHAVAYSSGAMVQRIEVFEEPLNLVLADPAHKPAETGSFVGSRVFGTVIFSEGPRAGGECAIESVCGCWWVDWPRLEALATVLTVPSAARSIVRLLLRARDSIPQVTRERVEELAIEAAKNPPEWARTDWVSTARVIEAKQTRLDRREDIGVEGEEIFRTGECRQSQVEDNVITEGELIALRWKWVLSEDAWWSPARCASQRYPAVNSDVARIAELESHLDAYQAVRGAIPQYATADPPITDDMLDAASKAWCGPLTNTEAWSAVYRAMRAREPMPITPGLWSDNTYRSLLAELDAWRAAAATCHIDPRCASIFQAHLIWWPQEMATPYFEGEIGRRKISNKLWNHRLGFVEEQEQLGPHLSALRDLP